MLKKLVILGTSGLAREMAMLVEKVNSIENKWSFNGFIGEKGCEIGKELGLGKIIGDDEWLLKTNEEYDIIIGIGFPKIRNQVLKKFLEKKSKFSFPNIVHPSADIDFNKVVIGEGNVITAGCIFTCDIRVGNFNLFNLNTTVGHDAIIGNYNVLNPTVNISGFVELKDEILIGTGAQILEHLFVESAATIGAGAVVTKNIYESKIYVGIPARPIN